MLLILGGELIFALPFHVTRFLRPSLLEATGLSNGDLGDLFAVYGISAALSYAPGGWLADRLPLKHLLPAALLATAAGGLVFAGLPGKLALCALFGYWGITTILLFWAGMIKATRLVGGALAQGRAFGLLEAGRGGVAAAATALALLLFAQATPGADQVLSDSARREGLRLAILGYTALTAAAGLLLWWLLPPLESARTQRPLPAAPPSPPAPAPLDRMALWLQASIILCAYCGYKGIDNYAIYMMQRLEFSEVASANYMGWGAWLRPLGALAAGFAADRWRPSRVLSGCFAAAALLCAIQAVAPAGAPVLWLGLNLGCSALAIFALRGVYFAVLAESGTPPARTGLAVGIVSAVGFAPDIFFASLSGRLLDSVPGVAGLTLYFWMLAGLMLAGAVCAAALTRHADSGDSTL